MARSKNRKSRRSSRNKNTAAPKNNQTSQSSQPGRNAAGQSGNVRQESPSPDGTVSTVPGDILPPAGSGNASASASSPAPAGSAPSVTRGQGEKAFEPVSKDSGFYGLSSSESSAMDDFDDIPLDPSSLDLWFLQDTPALAPFSEAGQDDSLFDGDLFDTNMEEAPIKAPENSQDNSRKNIPENSQDNSRRNPRKTSRKRSRKASRDNVSPADRTDRTSNEYGKMTSSALTDDSGNHPPVSDLKNSREETVLRPDASSVGRKIPGTAGYPTTVDQSADGAPVKSSQWKSAVVSAMSPPPPSKAPGSEQEASGPSNPSHTGTAGESPVSGYSAAASVRTSSASGQNPAGSSPAKQAPARGTGFPRRNTNAAPARGSSLVRKEPPAFTRQIPAYSAPVRAIVTIIGILFCLMVVMYFRARNAGDVPNLGIILPILQSHQENVELNNSPDENANAEPAVDITASPENVPDDSGAQDSQESVNTEQTEGTDPALSENPAEQTPVQPDSGMDAGNTDNADSNQNGYIENGQTDTDGVEGQNYEDGNTYNEGEVTEENGGDQLGEYYQEGNGYYDDDGRYYEDVENQNEDEYDNEDEEEYDNEDEEEDW